MPCFILLNYNQIIINGSQEVVPTSGKDPHVLPRLPAFRTYQARGKAQNMKILTHRVRYQNPEQLFWTINV